MKKNSAIITYNVNGYRPVQWTIPFAQRLTEISEHIRVSYGLPSIILFQEVIAGRKLKYLTHLRMLFPEYEIILPAGFDYLTHYKSIISVTLVRRDILGSYSVVKLDDKLPNRTCYVIAEIEGHAYHVVNCHIAQIQNFNNQASWYISERHQLNAHQWKLVHEALHSNNSAAVILAGDLQECSTENNIRRLQEDGYFVVASQTVTNPYYNAESCIDHIVLNAKAKATIGDCTITYDDSGIGRYSDHTLLYCC